MINVYEKSIYYISKLLFFNADANTPDECCFNYYPRKLPINKVTSYMVTRTECNKPGVM